MEQLPAGVSLFFIQLLVILAVARLVGALALKLGQPRVVGEMIAGILLGPTLFGALAPQLQAQLFAADYRACAEPRRSNRHWPLYVSGRAGI